MALRVSKVTGCPSRATRGGPIRLDLERHQRHDNARSGRFRNGYGTVTADARLPLRSHQEVGHVARRSPHTLHQEPAPRPLDRRALRSARSPRRRRRRARADDRRRRFDREQPDRRAAARPPLDGGPDESAVAASVGARADRSATRPRSALVAQGAGPYQHVSTGPDESAVAAADLRPLGSSRRAPNRNAPAGSHPRAPCVRNVSRTRARDASSRMLARAHSRENGRSPMTASRPSRVGPAALAWALCGADRRGGARGPGPRDRRSEHRGARPTRVLPGRPRSDTPAGGYVPYAALTAIVFSTFAVVGAVVAVEASAQPGRVALRRGVAPVVARRPVEQRLLAHRVRAPGPSRGGRLRGLARELDLPAGVRAPAGPRPAPVPDRRAARPALAQGGLDRRPSPEAWRR